MMLSKTIQRGILFGGLLIISVSAFAATQMGSAFSYQGSLSVGGAPANGLFDLNFTLFDAATGVVVSGATQSKTSVNVQNGFFKVDLDFTTSPFNGDARWLEIAVKATGAPGAFTTLTPRQELKPTPYAITAGRLYSEIPGGPLGVSIGSDAGIPAIGFNFSNGATGMTIGTTLAGRADTTSLANFYTPSAKIGADIGADSNGGFLEVRYPNASASTGVFLDTSGNLGSLQAYNAAGTRLAYLGVGSSNGGTLSLFNSSGNLTITLNGQTGVKSFVAADPSDPSKQIVYGCPEGPEAAIYCRGTVQLVNGEATVELPGHFTSMCAAKGMTVQVTPQDAASFGLAVVERSPQRIRIKELAGGKGNYAVDWQATGVRLGLEDFQPVRTVKELQAMIGAPVKTGPERTLPAIEALRQGAAQDAR